MTREEAVEVLKERYLTCVGIGLDNHANRVNEAIDMAIEALSAENSNAKTQNSNQETQKSKAEWIPCSERLPEFPFISCDAHGNIHVPQGIFTFEDSRGTWCIDDIYDNGKGMNYGNRIIAWMPLPKPYKGGDSE